LGGFFYSLVSCKKGEQMGWKGAVRSIGAAARAAERDAKRRQRELERQQKQYQKLQELEQAAYEVEVFENHIEIIQSVHKECNDPIDWLSISTSKEPIKPENLKKHEKEARSKVKSYSPSLIDKILKKAEQKKKVLEQNIGLSIKKDKTEHNDAISAWEEKVADWKESVSLAKQLLSGAETAKINAIKELNPFSEISTLGSNIAVVTGPSGFVEATIHVHGKDIVPNEVKSLLKSGKLSVKNMPKGTFNEIYQDYVCSSSLRVAKEILSIIPDNLVVVTATDELLNSKTGHLEKTPILSVCISRKTLNSLNMNSIDPSDSMDNFIHNMSFKKTKGFEPVSRIDTTALETAKNS